LRRSTGFAKVIRTSAHFFRILSKPYLKLRDGAGQMKSRRDISKQALIENSVTA
jgi:hypothetical protein